MRTYLFNIIFLLASIMPFTAFSQEKIIEAFDAIINSKGIEIEQDHFLQRDMDTGVKIGQSDVYEFDIPKNKVYLLKDALKAFEQESGQAYSMSSGEKRNKTKDIVLAVGDGKSNNVVLTTPSCHYIYACFLAPKEEDPDGNYRYAYAISYDEDLEDLEKDEDVSGKLVITYAATMKHRQDNSVINSVRDLSDPETWVNDKNLNRLEAWTKWDNQRTTEPWIRVFIKYVTAMGYSNVHTRATNAGYLYEVTSIISSYKDVSEQDKATARGILEALINDKTNSDPVVQQILKNALENIK